VSVHRNRQATRERDSLLHAHRYSNNREIRNRKPLIVKSALYVCVCACSVPWVGWLRAAASCLPYLTEPEDLEEGEA
jgi:hypothetical protein